MASEQHFPVHDRDRTHLEQATRVARRLLEFDPDIAPSARYIIGQATKVQAVKGSYASHVAQQPIALPHDFFDFSPTYRALLDQPLFYVKHRFHSDESATDMHVIDATILMRNQNDQGRALLSVETHGDDRKYTLQQGSSRRRMDEAEPLVIDEPAAADLVANIIRHAGHHPRDLRGRTTLDELLPMLDSEAPALTVTRETVLEAPQNSVFDKAAVEVSEQLQQAQGSAPIASYEVGCTGTNFPETYPGIISTIELSLATNPDSADIHATMQGLFEFRNSHAYMALDGRNDLIDQTMRPYQAMGVFMNTFDRLFQSILTAR